MKVGELSGGERNRVHMAKLVKSGANVLILDEPTNDLDVDASISEEAIEAFGGVSIVISHDRWFLDRIATHILAFEGDSHVEWFEGNFTDYEADRKKRLGEEAQPRRVKFVASRVCRVWTKRGRGRICRPRASSSRLARRLSAASSAFATRPFNSRHWLIDS